MNKNTLLYILIAIGAIGGLVGAAGRYRVEQQNRAVEIAVDYMDALQLSLAAHKPFEQTLRALKESGVTSLAIAEDPIDSLRQMGAMSEIGITPTDTVLTFEPSFPGQQQRVWDALTHKTKLTFTESGDVITVHAPYTQFSLVGVGLNPVDVTNAMSAGFNVCPRIYNYPGVSTTAIDWMISQVKQECTDQKGVSHASVVIFNGLDVLGNRGKIAETAAALGKSGLYYGSIEFGKQVGDEELSRAAIDSTVRVHSIAGSEMATMEEPTAIGRFILGARERNIRLCYVRMFLNGTTDNPDVMAANTDFVHQIVMGLKDGGLKITSAHAYRKEPLPTRGMALKLILVSLMLGSIGGCLLLARFTVGISGRAYWVLLAIGLLGGLFLLRHGFLGREILALAAACAFPSIGLIAIRLPRSVRAEPTAFWALEQSFRRFVIATWWTGLGILMVVGLLASRIFMLHIDGFIGIRLALVVPMFVTLAYYGLGLSDLPIDAGWDERKRMVKERYAEFSRTPLTAGTMVYTLIGLIVVAVIVLRSGNDPGVEVSGTEHTFRALLTKILFVRPRTKEFLFAHPLMIFGLASAFLGNKKWLTLFLAIGAIGEADVLNTFCHIHTPIFVSAIRAILGWILGALIGSALFLLASKWMRADAQSGPSEAARSFGVDV